MEDVSSILRIVIDASVTLSWLLPSETLQVQANILMERYEKHQVDVRCPSLIAYEVLNGIRSAALSKRIKENQLDEAYARYHALGIPIDDLFIPNDETLHLAMSHNLSLYDASYIHFAAQQKRVLYTADRKFVNKLKVMKLPIVYLGDFG